MDRVREGDLYKSIVIDDVTFEIRYGYYEEQDRFGKYNDPIPVYPDFTRAPIYNKEGKPFATEMQDKCPMYQGKPHGDGCNTCIYYEKCEDLLGICQCEKNKRD